MKRNCSRTAASHGSAVLQLTVLMLVLSLMFASTALAWFDEFGGASYTVDASFTDGNADLDLYAPYPVTTEKPVPERIGNYLLR